MLNQFKDFKLRNLIILEVLVVCFLLLLAGLGEYFQIKLDEGLFEQMVSYLVYLVAGLYIYFKFRKMNIPLKAIWGEGMIQPGFKTDFICFLVTLSASISSVYLIFYPLSFLMPDFVQFWIIENDFFYTSADQTQHLVLCNILEAFMISIFGPVIEEIVFRGFILYRFTFKWGTKRAVVFSSLLFGILHSDLVGSFLFSMLMCVIYLRTQSLWTTIFFHCANNSLVVSLYALEFIITGTLTEDTLIDFQAEVWQGILATPIFILGFYYLYHNRLKDFLRLKTLYTF